MKKNLNNNKKRKLRMSINSSKIIKLFKKLYHVQKMQLLIVGEHFKYLRLFVFELYQKN